MLNMLNNNIEKTTSERKNTQERVCIHPCYSDSASKKYARMHLPVAPTCNIQCNYCNRRYDCASENRPGVSSRLLTADEAFNKVRDAYRLMPELSIIGIAGPGDALASPHITFNTFEKIRSEFPVIKFCLSTNGLALPENLDRIDYHNVEYVTVTVNAINAVFGKKIYKWVKHNGITHYGEEAADILWTQQRIGLKGLVDKGILVKVNTVLIPGINDSHIVEIAREVKNLGVYSFNIIPVIPVPSTAFSHLPPPSDSEYKKQVEACSPFINIMRHCQRCRADALGMLGGKTITDCSLSYKHNKLSQL